MEDGGTGSHMIKQLSIAFLLSASLASCVKKPAEVPEPTPDLAKKILVILNEGAWNQNNASLTTYADGTTSQQVYEALNGEKIGDVANDIKQYGGKIYIIVNESSNLLVLNASTLTLIKRIPLFDGGIPRSPRNIVFNNDKAFFTAFDGTVHQLDTASLTLEKQTKAGRNPEGLVVQNGKLYVTNSGGLDYPNYDTTVSVIDLATFSEIKKIPVGVNPGGIATDSQGDVYVVARGNHGDILPQLIRINSVTDEVEDTLSHQVFSVKIKADKAFVSYNNASFDDPQLRLFDPLTETIADTLFADLSSLQGYYGFDILEEDVICFDAMNFSVKGYAYWFDKTGQLKKKIAAGFIPSGAIIKN